MADRAEARIDEQLELGPVPPKRLDGVGVAESGGAEAQADEAAEDAELAARAAASRRAIGREAAETIARVDAVLRRILSGAPEGGAEPAPQSSRLLVEGAEEAYERRAAPLLRAWETVPQHYRWAGFNAQLRERVSPAERIEESKRRFGLGRSLLISGPSEAGKTSLAVAFMHRTIGKALRVMRQRMGLEMLPPPLPSVDEARGLYRMAQGALFVTAFDLAKAGIHSPLGAEPELVRRAREASLLVLDELGTEVDTYRGAAASAVAVKEVIHQRHADGRTTIITTFLSRADLVRHYGAGIGRRVVDPAWMAPVDLEKKRAARKP